MPAKRTDDVRDRRPQGKADLYEPLIRTMNRMPSHCVEHKELANHTRYARIHGPLIARSKFLRADNIELR